jgi:hypothetical protein
MAFVSAHPFQVVGSTVRDDRDDLRGVAESMFILQIDHQIVQLITVHGSLREVRPEQIRFEPAPGKDIDDVPCTGVCGLIDLDREIVRCTATGSERSTAHDSRLHCIARRRGAGAGTYI